MGLEVLNKKSQNVNNKIEKLNDVLVISDLIIPFSIIFRNSSIPDIYSGDESIAFIEKDPNFQQILISEFLI
ncbi:MAG: hypothetical protein ACFE9C_16630 [Candidatus Hodarchaeota archaeon]